MSFIADRQTLDDLNLLNKYRRDSIFSLFNKVNTAGGEKLLDQLFRNPLSDPDEINARSLMLQWVGDRSLVFPFDRQQIGALENYLGAGSEVNLGSIALHTARKKLMALIVRDESYTAMETGIRAAIGVLQGMRDFLDKFANEDIKWDHAEPESPFFRQLQKTMNILTDKRLTTLLQHGRGGQLSLLQAIRYDHLLRGRLRKEMGILLEFIYQADLHIAVAGVGRSKGFSYARALDKQENTLQIREFHHPALTKAVPNSITMHAGSNMLFLTGANMAGKSTFMKAFGISLYLAHMGFPVPAKEMIFSVKDGICSSINVPDNLGLGYSHFYAEVLRVKTVAEAVSAGKHLIVLFDELFKGTNVKDAYEATLAVTEALTAYRMCLFLISTHIVEVGESLRKTFTNFQFAFLPTLMKGTKPLYTYALSEGISADRHGMMIIRDERILEIIQSSAVTTK